MFWYVGGGVVLAALLLTIFFPNNSTFFAALNDTTARLVLWILAVFGLVKLLTRESGDDRRGKPK